MLRVLKKISDKYLNTFNSKNVNQDIYFYLIIFGCLLLFFWKFFFKGLLPAPFDLLAGTYFPWFDNVYQSSPYGIPVKNTALSDIVSIMYPWRQLAIDVLKSGHIPFWNQYIFSGTPLLANLQSAPFYPLNIFYWLTDRFEIAWSLQVISQPVLATIFMFVYLKNLKLKFWTTVFGSLSWGFSGFFMTWLEYNTIVHASCYLPLILYACHKTITNRKYFILISLSLALSFYAGYPQITLYVLGFSTVYTLFVVGRQSLGYYLTIGFAVLMGMMFSAPLTLPAYDFNKYSIRQEDRVAEAADIKYIPIKKLITFVAPDYYGNPTTRNYWLVYGSYENAVLFVGVVVFVLFLLSFFVKDKSNLRLLRFLRISFFVVCLLIFKSPLSNLYDNHIPQSFSAAVMGRLVVLLTFCTSVLSAFSFEYILLKKVTLKSIIFSWAGVIVLFTFYILLTFKSDYASISLRNMVLPTVSLLLITAILFLGYRLSIKKYNYFVILLIPLLILELFRFSDKYNAFSPPDMVYAKSKITDYIVNKQTRVDHESGPLFPSNTWMPYKLYSSSGQDAVHSIRYNKFINYINTGKLQPSSRYLDIKRFDNQFVDFLSVQNLVVIKWKNATPDYEGSPHENYLKGKFSLVFDHNRLAVLENKNSFPPAFVVKNYKIANSDEEFENVFSDIDLSNTLVLEEEPKDKNLTGVADIINFNRTDTNLSVVVESEGNNLLVISQAWLPELRAFVNQNQVPLYRANYTFIAVPLSDGINEIEILYEPSTFKKGLIVSLIGLLLSSLVYIFFALKKR